MGGHDDEEGRTTYRAQARSDGMCAFWLAAISLTFSLVCIANACPRKYFALQSDPTPPPGYETSSVWETERVA